MNMCVGELATLSERLNARTAYIICISVDASTSTSTPECATTINNP